MPKTGKILLIAFLITIFLAGCSSTYKTGQKKYPISQFSDDVALKDASLTCQSLGLTVILLNERRTKDKVIIDYTCLDTKSSEYKKSYHNKINSAEEEKVIFKI